MNLDGLGYRFQVLGFQFPDEFQQPPAIKGTDLVGFDLGVLGQVAPPLGKKKLKSQDENFGSLRVEEIIKMIPQ